MARAGGEVGAALSRAKTDACDEEENMFVLRKSKVQRHHSPKANEFQSATRPRPETLGNISNSASPPSKAEERRARDEQKRQEEERKAPEGFGFWYFCLEHYVVCCCWGMSGK